MSRRDRVFAAALVVFALSTIGLQAFTTKPIKIAAKAWEASHGHADIGGRALLALVPGALRPGDWVLVVLAAGSGLLVIGLEIRGAAIRRFLAAALADRRAAVALFLLVAALTIRTGLDAGIPNAGDAKLHFAKTASVMRALAAGESPSWSHEWYAGMPLLRFYGPLFYLLAGGFGALVGSAEAGVKIVLVLVHLLGALFAAGWLRRLTGSGRAALVGGLIVLLAGPRGHELYGLGRLPVALVYAAFPLALWGVERFVRGDRFVAAGATTALGLAALLLAHPGLAPFGLVLTVLYGVLRFIPGEGWAALRRRATIGYVATVAVVATALAGWWLVPALGERSHVMLDLQYGGTPSVVPTFDRPAEMAGAVTHPLLARAGLLPRVRGGSSVGYAGAALVLLGVLGLLRALHGRTRLALALLVPLALGVAWTGGGYFQARCVHFLTPLLAGGAALWFSRTPDDVAPRWGRLAIVVLLVDLLPAGVATPFRPDLEPLRASFRGAAAEHPHERVVYGSVRGGAPAVSQWGTGLDSGLLVLGGPFREAATEVYPWAMGLLAWTEEALRSGEPPPAELRAALARFGVSRVAIEDGVSLRDVSRTSEAPLLIVPIARGRLQTGTPLADRDDRGIEPDLRALFDASRERDAAARWAERLRAALIEEGSISSPSDGDSGEHPAPGRVTSLAIDRSGLAATVDADEPCDLSVRVAAYPGTEVIVDGTAKDLRRDRFGFVMVGIDTPGTHRIEVRPPRRGPEGLAAIGLGIVLVAVVVTAVTGRTSRAGMERNAD